MQETIKLVRIGRSGTLAHVARVAYAMQAGRQCIVRVQTLCGDVKLGSRTLATVLGDDSGLATCNRCSQALAQLSRRP